MLPPKENLHLRGKLAALRHRLADGRHIGPQARRAENHILVDALQIILSQPQAAALALQFLRQVAQLLPAALIAGGDGNAIVQQQVQQRRIADADAHHRHGAAP